jgi:poly(A) polymerase
MQRDIIQRIAEKFAESNYEAFVVGGHVRDELLGRASTDVDFATDALPQDTKRLLEQFGNVYTVGEEYGTIGLIAGEYKIEVTTYRGEVYPSDSRKPNVAFGQYLRGDLERRDFTINALARDALVGGIIDYFGGLEDLKNKVIRCVGNDTGRFNEDPLRMMRAVRFACQLHFDLDVKIENPERLSIISNERIKDELVKILLSDRAAYGIRSLCDLGLMRYIIPEFLELNIPQGRHHIKDAFEHSLLVLKKGTKIDYGEDNLVFRLACLLHDIAKPETKTEDESGIHFYAHHHVGAEKAAKILERLRFDKDTIKRVCHLIRYHMNPLVLQKEREIKKRTIRRMIRSVGEANIYMLLNLVRCDTKSSSNPRHKFILALTHLVEECMQEQPETLISPLSGDEIMKIFNLKPGKLVGEIKSHLTNLVVDGMLGKEDKDKASEEAKSFIERS